MRMVSPSFLDAIIVGIKAQPEYTQHQNLPLCHAGTTVVGIDFDYLSFYLTFRQYLCHLPSDSNRLYIQGICTPLVHAHAGRTQVNKSDRK